MFTHPSFVGDRSRSYERLEFLGDSVLELAIARILYERFPDATEGELTRIRATVVSRASCAIVGRSLDLGARLVGAGNDAAATEDVDHLAATGSVLAALLEALLGALYLEYGLDPVRDAIGKAFAERIEYAITTRVDHKTQLQEELARLGRQVAYTVLETSGPAHQRRFTCGVVIDGEIAGVGTGSSKKEAEQAAARQALERLGAGD